MFAFLDNTTNFAKSTIANAGGINSAVTSVTVATGDGAKFPSSNFNVVLWDVATYADPADDAGREIVRCTSRSSDVLTITRAQEGTTASSHAQNAGVMLAFTDKMRDDIEAYLQGKLGSDIASASTTDIGASTGQGVTVTGTTTITALGTADAGTYRRVTFSGALTLTHNATSLILPGSANITTAAGDVAYFESLGSGNWRCVGYMRANGQALASSGGSWTKIGTFTSAGTTTTFEYLFTAIPTSYKLLKLTGYFTRNSGDAQMRLNGESGGTAYFSSMTYWDTAGGVEHEGGGTNDRITPLVKGGSGTERYVIELTFSNQASTPNGFIGTWALRSIGSTTVNNRGLIQGGLVSSAQITSISMTNITSGDFFVLEGIS